MVTLLHQQLGLTRGLLCIPASGSDNTMRLATSTLVQDCVAGDTIVVGINQTSGGNIATSKNDTKCVIYRYRNNSIPTGSVSGILIGIG